MPLSHVVPLHNLLPLPPFPLLSPPSALTFSPSFPTCKLGSPFSRNCFSYASPLSWSSQGGCSWFYLLLLCVEGTSPLIKAPNTKCFVCVGGGIHWRFEPHCFHSSGSLHQSTLFLIKQEPFLNAYVFHVAPLLHMCDCGTCVPNMAFELLLNLWTC
jgi:hypothetical protein